MCRNKERKKRGSLSIVGVNKIQNQFSAAGAKAPAAFLRAGIDAKFYS
jgi:hypothetical protein